VFTVLTLNRISPRGLARLPEDRYRVGDGLADPDAILVRSASMHDLTITANLKAVGRAGAGVSNIPVDRMSARGIPVFNTPGANANAVKELVIAALVLGCRHICPAWDFARQLEGTDEEIGRAVEAGKSRFVGVELPGHTLGVIGLGAIGRLVANTGLALGMSVIGFDPGLTIEGAWQLSSQVAKAGSIEELLRVSDFVTVHVPLTKQTRELIDGGRLRSMRHGTVLLNFARQAIVDEGAVVEALGAGRLGAYVCDFPSNQLKNHPGVVALPHLGASTLEAEENCAVMVADQVRAFLEHGHIRNAVNFPDVELQRGTPYRLTCANANVPSMLSQISEVLGQAGLNIHDMVNRSREQVAYTIVDLDAPVPPPVVGEIASIGGVLRARLV
jgi:D-3-phosphoglycerate dehydrogenase